MKKTKFSRNLALLSFLSITLGCSTFSGFGSGSNQFQMRPFQEKTLANGLRILYIKDGSLPRVGLHLMVASGSAQDPEGSEGLSAFTLSLLEHGTAKKSALQIADEFAQLGSTFVESASSDYSMVSTSGLSETKEKLLSLYADVIMNPAFAGSEVERKRSQVLADLASLQDQPTEYSGLLFDKELFGKHPYGHSIYGTVPSVKSLTRSQVIRHYFSQFRPNNAWLAITGNFDEKFQENVEKTFSQWQQAKIERAPLPNIGPIEKLNVKLYSKSDLDQAQIRIGQLGISRTDPDFLKLRIANVVLGGAFASRLNQKIRDDLGLTYSISSQVEAKKGTGSFEVYTFAKNEKVADVIQQTLRVLENFQKEGITSKELQSAKALLVGQFPASVETVDRLAFNLMALRVYNVPDTYLSEYFKNVNSIKLKDVNAAISKHFQPSKMKIVVFADEKAVASQLKQVGEFQVEKVETAQ